MMAAIPRRPPRFREVDRSLVLPELTLDDAIPADHRVRQVLAFVEVLDLSAFHSDIKAVEGSPGRNTTPITVLLGLWIYAILDGIASAREIYRQCQTNLVYRWILGGLTVDYHTISDFRQKTDQFEQLLIDYVTALRFQGIVTFESAAQDGMRTRASAGAGSAHRLETLEQTRAEVKAHLEALQQQEGEAVDAAQKRSRAAKQRHLEEQCQRLDEAMKVVHELNEKREQRLAKHPSEAKQAAGQSEKKKAARASSTDPEARKMKMPDGGTRLAYNVQSLTDVDSGIIIAVDVTNQGSDGGLMKPMLQQMQRQYQEQPQNEMNDGGFMDKNDVEYAEAQGIKVYMPLKNEQKDLDAGKNPYEAKKGDKAGMAKLRQRMSTPEAKQLYKKRASTAEWVNARMRNWGLYGFLVRGLKKVRGVVLLHALTHNLLQTQYLCRKNKKELIWTEILRADRNKIQNKASQTTDEDAQR
jgi:transposase